MTDEQQKALAEADIQSVPASCVSVEESGEMSAQIYGYIRVSTKDQNEARQIDALAPLNILPENLFIDKQSGKDFNRPEYIRLFQRLKEGDTLFVKSIDRLGRNYEDIQEQWRVLVKEKKVNIVVLDMPILDTRGENTLIRAFIADIVLQLLAFVAENERTNIRARQAEGIAAAKARGVRFGRPSKPLPDNFMEVVSLWRAGTITGLSAAKQCGMPMSSFRYRAAHH